MTYSIQYHDGNKWNTAQSGIRNRATAEQVRDMLKLQYPTYSYQILKLTQEIANA